MAISYTQVVTVHRPAQAAPASEQRAPRPSHFLIRAASGVANLIGRWCEAQVTILPGASDKTVAQAALRGLDHYDTMKWNALARHYGGRQVL